MASGGCPPSPSFAKTKKEKREREKGKATNREQRRIQITKSRKLTKMTTTQFTNE